MAIENVYSYLEYLALTVDQLADAVIEREEETAVYEARLQEMSEALAHAEAQIAAQASQPAPAEAVLPSDAYIQDIMNQADARIQLAEARAVAAEKRAEELAVLLKSAKQPKRKADPQMDMFAAPSAPPPSAPAPVPVATKSNQVANDQNALILAKKLDSTIDKVQKLIREARA